MFVAPVVAAVPMVSVGVFVVVVAVVVAAVVAGVVGMIVGMVVAVIKFDLEAEIGFDFADTVELGFVARSATVQRIRGYVHPRVLIFLLQEDLHPYRPLFLR